LARLSVRSVNEFINIKVYGGEIGIRTLGTLLRYAGFQDQPRDQRNGDFHAVKKDFAGFSKGRAFNREWQGHSDSIRY